jgi:S-adenosylmethionine:tRNA ribosyltransferase-isomerase
MMEKEQIEKYTARTQLFIVPGYNFRIIDTLITNFHLPQSTLILLVAAFAGKELWKTVYHEAISRNYRFLSYGDASLIFGAKFQERNYQF